MACRMPAVIDTLTIDVITYAHHCGFVPLNALAYTLTTDELGILFICLQLELIHSIPVLVLGETVLNSNHPHLPEAHSHRLTPSRLC